MKSGWRTSLVLMALAMVLVGIDQVCAQQTEADHDSAVQATTAAGGRVMKISQASDDLEVAFHLSDQEIKDEALQHLPEINHVIWLNLSGTKISNDGLAVVGKLKELKKLHLEKTAIGDEGLQHLSNLEGLEYLNLYGTQVTDGGLTHLAGLHNLRKLFVWQTKVTAEGMASLSNQLPDLQIVAGVSLDEPNAEKPKDQKQADPEKKSGTADKGTPDKADK